MARDHMLRTWVFQFESSTEEPLPRPASNFLASLGTHDLPRFGTYLWGEDIDEREANGALSSDQATEERSTRARWRRRLFDALGFPADMAPRLVTAQALREILLHLARSDAKIVLVDMEEMWDERLAQNRPGTEAAGNWRRRTRRTLEDFSSDPEINRTLSELTAVRAS
jgi:4-alpha-glucanotransferase